MITWLQNLTQKHHKIIFSILLIVITVAFVFVIGNLPFLGGSAPKYNSNFYGFDLAKSSNYLGQSAYLSANLGTKLPYDVQEDSSENSLIFSRAVMLYLAGTMSIAEPTKQDYDDFVKSLEVFKNPETNQFDVNSYNALLQRYGAEFVKAVLMDDWRIIKALNLVCGPGFIINSDVASFTDVYDVEVAIYPMSNFKPTKSFSATEEEIKKFYEENKNSYNTDRVLSASYVVMPINSFSLTDLEIERFYNKYLKAKAEYNSQEYSSLDADKKAQVKKIADENKLFEMKQEAEEKAKAIRQELFAAKVSFGQNEEIASLIEKAGLKKVAMPPILNNICQTSPISQEQVSASAKAFSNENFIFTFVDDKTAGILIFEAVKEPSVKTYAQARDEVKTQVEESKKLELFKEELNSLKSKLNAQIKDGKTFAQATKDDDMKATTIQLGDYLLVENQKFMQESIAKQFASLSSEQKAQKEQFIYQYYQQMLVQILEMSKILESVKTYPLKEVEIESVSNSSARFVFVSSKEVLSEKNAQFAQAKKFLEKANTQMNARNLVSELVKNGKKKLESQNQ